MYVCMHVFIHSLCPALSAIGVHISWSRALLSQVIPVHRLHFTCICGWSWDALLGELHILRVSLLSPPVLWLLPIKRAKPSGQTHLPPSHNPPKRSIHLVLMFLKFIFSLRHWFSGSVEEFVFFKQLIGDSRGLSDLGILDLAWPSP